MESDTFFNLGDGMPRTVDMGNTRVLGCRESHLGSRDDRGLHDRDRLRVRPVQPRNDYFKK